VDPNDSLQPHEFEDEPIEVVEEEEEQGDFTGGIPLNLDDDAVIWFESESGNTEVILEEELELGEFTDGIILGPEDFLQPHEFEDEPGGIEIIAEEEEFGEWQEEQV